MAKKKKNRQNDYIRKKADAARRTKEYFARLKVICNMIHPDLYTMLDAKQRMVIYMMRATPFKIVCDGKIPKELQEYINDFARLIQKEEMVPLGTGDVEISLTEYDRYLSPLEWLIRPGAPREIDIRPDPDRFNGIPWYEDFFKGRDERFEIYHNKITHMLSSITYFMSDLRHAIYYTWFETKTDTSKNPHNMTMSQRVHVQPCRVERRHIRLHNGDIRNALEMKFPFPPDSVRSEKVPDEYRFLPLIVPPADLGVTEPRADKPLPVYVTEHALNRLDERTGCASPGYVQQYILTAFTNKLAQKTNDDRLLLEYHVRKQKIGYLVISIQKKCILVHTFLFLTADSTPEGRKLRAQLGLQKLDHQYLGMDKLSTFVHSDILQHEDVCEWFRNAGCESLLRVCELLKGDDVWEQEGERIQLAGRLKEYLETSQTEDEWEIPEDDEEEADTEETGEDEEAENDDI